MESEKAERPALTEEGRAWAEKAATGEIPSIVALVALMADNPWPQSYVDTAVRQANARGELDEGGLA